LQSRAGQDVLDETALDDHGRVVDRIIIASNLVDN
jgi:hypothetical protein